MNTVTKQTGKDRPEMVTVTGTLLGRKVRVINFDVAEKEDGSYEWEQISIHPDDWSYSGIIACLVRSRYSDDDVTAIVLNAQLTTDILGDSVAGALRKLAEYAEELIGLQKWRIKAKNIAKEAIALSE